MRNELILIADPEPQDVQKICGRLSIIGYRVVSAGSGIETLQLISVKRPDLLVTETDLPDMSGFDLCRAIQLEQRKKRIPIIFYTHRDAKIDLVVGFEIGADDYVSKEIGVVELSLRIEAILRRRQPVSMESSVSVGDVWIDLEQSIVTHCDENIGLSPTEFKILKVLAREQGRALERREIIAEAWPGNAGIMKRTVDAHIKALRAKLSGMRIQITTIRGFGYCLREVDAQGRKNVNEKDVHETTEDSTTFESITIPQSARDRDPSAREKISSKEY